MTTLPLFAPRVVPQYMARPYQADADQAVDRELREKRSTLVVHATGLGKTVLFCMQAARRGGVLVLAHRDSLIKQAAGKLAAATGRHVAIEKAERWAFGSPYICASVQTLKANRLADFKRRFPDIEFIVTDEAHRSPAPSYRAIYDAYPEAKLLGVTATADRADGIAMGSVYDSVAHRFEIIAATEEAWLTPVEYVPLRADINLDKIAVRGADIDAAELDTAVADEAGKLVRAVFEAADGKRLLVFCPGVKTAHLAAEAANRMRPGSAAAVDGTTDPMERERIQAAHRAGDIKLLFNVDVYTEGYDDETLDGEVDFAKSLSRTKVMQRVGRITRLHSGEIGKLPTVEARRSAIAASPKPKAFWYDLVCNGERHSPIGPDDLLAGELPDEVRKQVKKIMRERGGDIRDAIAEAEEKIRRLTRAASAARAATVQVGKVRSLFELAGIKHLQDTTRGIRPEDYATPRQVGALRKRGIPVPEPCTKQMFRRLLGKEKQREAAGLTMLGAVNWLRWYGIDAWKMPRETSRRIHDAIVANDYAPLPPAVLADLSSRRVGEDG